MGVGVDAGVPVPQARVARRTAKARIPSRRNGIRCLVFVMGFMIFPPLVEHRPSGIQTVSLSEIYMKAFPLYSEKRGGEPRNEQKISRKPPSS